MAAPTPGSFLKFFQAVFKGAAQGAGNILVSASQALARLGARLQRIGAPGKQGFQPKAPTVKPFQPPKPSAVPPRPGRTAPGAAPVQQYTDGLDFAVRSSWIAGINFRPLGGRTDAVNLAMVPGRLSSAVNVRQYLMERGDLTMIVINPSRNNPGGRYTYPRVPRKVMNDMIMAPSKGRFYWWGYGGSVGLRNYSNRASIGRRMRSAGRFLIRNPISPAGRSRSRSS